MYLTLDRKGQLKLQSASVVVVGAGGLGCPAIQYLAAAGVGEKTICSSLALAYSPVCTGRIGIIDHDVVELSNLQRQILHTQDRLGMPKAVSAAKAVQQ